MSVYSIQTIDLDKDLQDKAFEANKKINFNLKQINDNAKLLPVSLNDPIIQDMSECKYLRTVYEVIQSNSKLIGFNYPDIEVDLAFAFKTKEKIYKPISEYFLTFIK